MKLKLSLPFLVPALALSLAGSIWAGPSPGFYTDIPPNLAEYEPGALIKWEPEADFAPALSGFAAYRIMYRSTGALGGPVAETGMVFVPHGSTPAGGWPVVVWAHGTTGVGDDCAPSKLPYMCDDTNDTSYVEMIANLLNEGYLVTAPDYEGLGTPGSHTYLNADSEALAVIYSVVAARAPALNVNAGVRWAVVGHSQGGQAALRAGELAPAGPGLLYVGAVAFAPGANLTPSVVTLLASSNDDGPYLAYMAVGIRAINPTFQYSQFLGPDYLGLMPLAEQDCWWKWFNDDTKTVYPTPETALSTNWEQDPMVLNYLAATEAGKKPAHGPVLVLQGMADSLYALYPALMEAMCSAGTTVHGITYANVGHGGVLTAGWNDARSWLAGRFAGRPARNGCLASDSTDFYYFEIDDTITIAGYLGTNVVVMVPETIEGLPVTRIGDSAFRDQSIKSVTVPATVMQIGDNAFSSCLDLTNVTLGTNVVGIGDWAFESCSSLTNLTIPDSVASIGDSAFSMTSLTDITLPASVTNLGSGVFSSCSRLMTIGVAAANPRFSSVAGVLFDQSQATLVQFPGGRGGSYVVPAGVARIGEHAFAEATSLTNVVLPNSVTDIEEFAFINCRGLIGLALPGNLVSLGQLAFVYCSSLTDVSLPDSLLQIGDEPFAACSALMAIRVGTNNPAYSSEDGVLFDKFKTRLIQYPAGKSGRYTVPAGVTNIGMAAFKGSEGLTHLDLPENLSVLEDWVCQDCPALTSISIPDGVPVIGRFAFFACTNLASVSIGTNVALIRLSAFGGCLSLKNITIPQSVSTIEFRAFFRCDGLSGVFFKGSPPILGWEGFGADGHAVAYYLPGASGWGTSYGALPAVLWNPRVLSEDPSFGIRAGHFGFTIAGTADIPVVVEACADLQQAVWQPVQSGSLTNGQLLFLDPNPALEAARFYRISSP